MSIVTHPKRENTELADMIAAFIAAKGIKVCKPGAKTDKKKIRERGEKEPA